MKTSFNVLSAEEIYLLILKGILDAKGSEKAIELLDEEDCSKIGEALANREAIRNTTFFSVVVEPINDIEEGKENGHYDSIYDHINPETVPLQKAEVKKRIYFVPVTKLVEKGMESNFLAKFGKRPIKNAPNYLLGAMSKLEEKDLPDDLKLKNFIAVSDDEEEIFSNRDGYRCFLYCRRKYGRRDLDMMWLVGEWVPENGLMFLAEDA